MNYTIDLGLDNDEILGYFRNTLGDIRTILHRLNGPSYRTMIGDSGLESYLAVF